MICTKCGANVNDNAAFCPECGAPLKKAAPAPNQPNIQRIDNTQGTSSIDVRWTGIAAYITIIGFIVAIAAGDKERAKHHLNQGLVVDILNIVSLILMRIPYIAVLGGLLYNPGVD